MERRDPLLCVYRARCVLSAADSVTKPEFLLLVSAEGNDFIVKNVIPDVFEYQQDLQKGLALCANLRTMVDTVPKFELFVYHFMTGNLLQVSAMSLSKSTRKSILRCALRGLADLHDRSIIHTGKSYCSG